MRLGADPATPAEPDSSAREADRIAEEAALRGQIDRVAEEKRRALLEPGPTWREWWFFSASKWYVVLGFLIGDVWAVTVWLDAGSVLGALLTLVGLFYAEYLLYEYLWYRPDERALRRRALFRRTWRHPVPFGRWTPEAQLVRSGAVESRDDEGPDLGEFV